MARPSRALPVTAPAGPPGRPTASGHPHSLILRSVVANSAPPRPTRPATVHPVPPKIVPRRSPCAVRSTGPMARSSPPAVVRSCVPPDSPAQPPPAATGLAGADTPAAALPHQKARDNVASWRPDSDSPRFTLVIMPDTHELERDRWWHVAAVNDAKDTTMYVDDCRIARNPATRTTGLAALGLPWLLGAYAYGGPLDQLMHGRLGDIRIVERALAVSDFMNA